MLKIRIIPCLLFKNRTIVKSVEFNNLRMIGDPTTCARVFNERNADELIFLDILASRSNQSLNFKVIEDIAKECYMPLTIGGGIRSIEDADKLFKIGADKIVINTPLVKNPGLLKLISEKYGSQAVVVSIDAKKSGGSWQSFIDSGKTPTGQSPVELAIRAQSLGAGEILLTSIERDGTMKGYDLDIIKQVSKSVNIPVIASGGCGSLQDFVDAVKIAGADAVSGASIFYFVGESIITAKKFMSNNGLPIRMI